MSQWVIFWPTNLARLRVRITLKLGRRATSYIWVENLLGLCWRGGSTLETLEGSLVFRGEPRRRGRCSEGADEFEAGEKVAGEAGGKHGLLFGRWEGWRRGGEVGRYICVCR